MILITPKKLLSSDTVPQSIKLDGCYINLANTVRNLGVSLDPALYFQQQIFTLCRISMLSGTSLDQYNTPLPLSG